MPFWTYEEWQQYQDPNGKTEALHKLRSEMSIRGRQLILDLIQDVINRMAFEEDMHCINNSKSRTYAEACQEIVQTLGTMKIKERTE